MLESLYIHIPFCRQKCAYCDFYSVVYQKDLARQYIDVLCGQIKNLAIDFRTIYIGGGTPAVLDIKLLDKLLKNLEKVSRKTVEFTIEVNPESLDRDKIKLFRDSGVNRLSIGVQSFYNDKLKKLDRIHSAQRALNSIFLAQKLGFKNINIDLIFGLWEETLVAWREELRLAVNLPITHISAYALAYERNTPLFWQLKKGEVTPLEDMEVTGMYRYAMDYLPASGFFQYEVSNFSKKGYRCRHNLNYWDNNAYLSLGVSAVSYVNRIREKYTSNIKNYLKQLRSGRSPVVFSEKLSLAKRAKETAALKIRTTAGINFKWFKKQTGFDFFQLESRTVLKELLDKKLLHPVEKNGKIVGLCLTKKGFLFCDTVSSSFL